MFLLLYPGLQSKGCAAGNDTWRSETHLVCLLSSLQSSCAPHFFKVSPPLPLNTQHSHSHTHTLTHSHTHTHTLTHTPALSVCQLITDLFSLTLQRPNVQFREGKIPVLADFAMGTLREGGVGGVQSFHFHRCKCNSRGNTFDSDINSVWEYIFIGFLPDILGGLTSETTSVSGCMTTTTTSIHSSKSTQRITLPKLSRYVGFKRFFLSLSFTSGLICKASD